METKTFKQRVIHASAWSFASHLLNQSIRFGSNLIMTRLLMPELFGLMAMANVFIFGLNLLSDMGLGQSLIQSKRSDETFLNTLWTVQVLRGCAIWVLSVLLGLILYSLNLLDVWPKESVYRDVLLPYLIAAIGFNSVINGFESTKSTTAKRELSLKKNVLIGFVSQVCGVTVTIVWAYLNKSVWAMVAGALTASLVKTILTHTVFTGITNRFHWNQAVFHDLFHFGKWIFVSSILGFLLSSSDRLVLGGLVDAKILGLYAIACFMIGALKDLLNNVIGNVAFPAFSEAYRNHPESLKKIYYKFRLPFDVVAIFSAGFLFATGEIIVKLLYDNRYVMSGWMLQILAISFFELRYRLSGQCYMAIGKPKILTNLILFSLVVLYVSASAIYHYFGFKGVIWVIAGNSVCTIPLNLYYMKKYNLLDWKSELLVLPLLPISYGIGLLFKYAVESVLY